MDLLNMSQAALFMGKHKNTLNNMISRGAIKPDLRVGRRRHFNLSTLQAFKDKIESLYSLDQIAEKYNQSWENVYYHFRLKRKVEMDNTLGRFLFTKESVEMVAKVEEWNNE